MMVQLERLDFTILGIEVRRQSGRGLLIRASLFGAARAIYPRYTKFIQALMRDDTDEKQTANIPRRIDDSDDAHRL